MSDFNGRIGRIFLAFRDQPVDIVSARMNVRDVLRDERADGYKEGHGDGIEDQWQAAKIEQQRLAKAHEEFVTGLLGPAPAQWNDEGTREEALTGYVRALEVVARKHLGRLPVPGDSESGESGEGER